VVFGKRGIEVKVEIGGGQREGGLKRVRVEGWFVLGATTKAMSEDKIRHQLSRKGKNETQRKRGELTTFPCYS